MSYIADLMSKRMEALDAMVRQADESIHQALVMLLQRWGADTERLKYDPDNPIVQIVLIVQRRNDPPYRTIRFKAGSEAREAWTRYDREQLRKRRANLRRLRQLRSRPSDSSSDWAKSKSYFWVDPKAGRGMTAKAGRR